MDFTLVDVYLNWFCFVILVRGLFVILIGCMMFLSPFLDIIKDAYVNSFFPRTTRLWNSLPAECLPLAYDLNGFSTRVIRNLLSSDSF